MLVWLQAKPSAWVRASPGAGGSITRAAVRSRNKRLSYCRQERTAELNTSCYKRLGRGQCCAANQPLQPRCNSRHHETSAWYQSAASGLQHSTPALQLALLLHRGLICLIDNSTSPSYTGDQGAIPAARSRAAASGPPGTVPASEPP